MLNLIAKFLLALLNGIIVFVLLGILVAVLAMVTLGALGAILAPFIVPIAVIVAILTFLGAIPMVWNNNGQIK